MNNRISCTLVVLVLSVVLQPAFAQSRQILKQLDELDRKCEAARDAVLPGIREQLIAECILPPPTQRVRQRTLEQCERYWNDYGVKQRQRAALDLPECQEAFQARHQYRSR
ncbi:hypothetical protein [Propionivibrio sp.]|uniref:hypothetical protein n=1 Tax=Propionivibrio sp. TaxID=2212460 RepID=UPI003BEF83B3